MSKFSQIVDTLLVEADSYEDMKYYQQHPNDHTGDDSIDLELDLPLSDNLAQTILKYNIVSSEDLQDDSGALLQSYPLETRVEYSVEGYPDDEEVTVNGIFLKTYEKENPYTDITAFLSTEYLQKVANQLEENGYIELNSIDPTIEWTKDYHNNLL